jgi:hypothetical protein
MLVNLMALEWIVPMAIFGAFVSTSGATWMRRQRRLEEGRLQVRARGWIVPVRVQSTFPMDIRGEVWVDTALDEPAAIAALSERALNAGYERAQATGVTVAFHRGSEWRALSSFDLCDVPSELVVWVEPAPVQGVTRLRCVMTYRTLAHFVSEEDVEQSTVEFSEIIASLSPLAMMGAPQAPR